MTAKKTAYIKIILGILALILLFVPGIGIADTDEKDGRTFYASISAFDYYMNNYEAPIIVSGDKGEETLGFPINVVDSLVGEDPFVISPVLSVIWLISYCVILVLNIALALRAYNDAKTKEEKSNKCMKEISHIAEASGALLFFPYAIIGINYLFAKLSDKEVGKLHVGLWLCVILLFVGVYITMIRVFRDKANQEKVEQGKVEAAENAVALYKMEENADVSEDACDKVSIILLSCPDKQKGSATSIISKLTGKDDIEEMIEILDIIEKKLPHLVKGGVSRAEAEVIAAKFAEIGAETKII